MESSKDSERSTKNTVIGSSSTLIKEFGPQFLDGLTHFSYEPYRAPRSLELPVFNNFAFTLQARLQVIDDSQNEMKFINYPNFLYAISIIKKFFVLFWPYIIPSHTTQMTSNYNLKKTETPGRNLRNHKTQPGTLQIKNV